MLVYVRLHLDRYTSQDSANGDISTLQSETFPPGKARVEGTLELTFGYDPRVQQTRLVQSKQQAPLRVIRPFSLPGGGALLHLHNVSGGVLGGDRLRLNVEVGAGASVQLTS